jgi:hypothetical protein
MRSVARRLVTSLRPGVDEIVQLVRAEMDPARYAEFQPITAGPLVAIVGLTAVALLGALCAPVRLLRVFRPR